MLESFIARMFRRSRVFFDRTVSPSDMYAYNASDGKATNNNTVHVEVDNSYLLPVKVARLYGDAQSSDVCLIVGDREYNAHRLILCMSSEVFQVMLLNPRWDESRQSRVQLQESFESCMVFEQFLRYFYTAQIKFNYITVMPFLMLADKYNVKDLVTACVEYMCKNVAHAAINKKLIAWLQYTLNLGHYEVAQACEEFLKWNFEWVCKETDFLHCEIQLLERLLEQSDLVVFDEMSVYKAVEYWLDNKKMTFVAIENVDVEHAMRELTERTMYHVRFPMMTPRQLAELLLNPLIRSINPHLQDFFIQRMAMGMAYHSNVRENLSDACKIDGGRGRLQFTPRLYTSDKWCSQLTVENYPELPLYFVHTLMFSSHTTIAEHHGENTCDWVIDLYPKGVWFRKFFLIVWQGTMEVPESVLRTVRVTVTCKDPPPGGVKVKVGILIKGEYDGLEHNMAVVQCIHRFVEGDNVLNVENMLPFDTLNSYCQSRFLVGPNRDKLKINFVITPLNNLSSSDNFTMPMKVWMR